MRPNLSTTNTTDSNQNRFQHSPTNYQQHQYIPYQGQNANTYGRVSTVNGSMHNISSNTRPYGQMPMMQQYDDKTQVNNAIMNGAMSILVGQLMGPTKAVEQLAATATNKLINKGKTDEFWKYMIECKKAQGKLNKLTESKIVKLVNGIVPDEEFELIYDTLEYIGMNAQLLANKIIKNMMQKQQIMDKHTYLQISNLTSKLIQCMDLKSYVKKARKDKTDKSIIEQINASIKHGWNNNTIIEIWNRGHNLELDIEKIKNMMQQQSND